MGDMQPTEPDQRPTAPVEALYWGIYVLDNAAARWHRGLDRLARWRRRPELDPAPPAAGDPAPTWASSPVPKRTV